MGVGTQPALSACCGFPMSYPIGCAVSACWCQVLCLQFMRRAVCRTVSQLLNFTCVLLTCISTSYTVSVNVCFELMRPCAV